MDIGGERAAASLGGHAIVIGASTTGLACAAVATRHFDQVTVLDRDRLPDDPVWRRGVPQSRHVHALLRGGQEVFNTYFPGLSEDMLGLGSVEVDMGRDVIWHHFGGWKVRFNSGVRMQCQTKGFLEWHVRKRLEQLPGVGIRSLCNVMGLCGDSRNITGVRMQDGEELKADLVIDASGRNSLTPRLLEQMGVTPPRCNELPVDIWYASQIFRPPPGNQDWRGMLIHSRPPATRTAALMPIEGGRWIVTLVGWHGDVPGSAHEDFMDWAKGLPTPVLHEAIRHAEPLDRVWRWNFVSNQRYHYEDCAAFPRGLVVVGDANTSLNPIYGQGMSQGAIGAQLLDETLEQQRAQYVDDPLQQLGPRFHRRYARFIDQCWMTSTTEDYGELQGSGRRAWYAPFLSNYLHRFTRLTWRDEAAARAFFRVMHMQKSPLSLMQPRFLVGSLIGADAASPAEVPAFDTG